MQCFYVGSKSPRFEVFYVDQLGHLLVCLVRQETMAVKNFVFRENWVGSKVGGMKTTFLAILAPTWTHILAPKGQ